MGFLKFFKKCIARPPATRVHLHKQTLISFCDEKSHNINCKCFFEVAEKHLREADDSKLPETVAKEIIREIANKIYESDVTKLDCVARQILTLVEDYDVVEFLMEQEQFCKHLLIEIVCLFAYEKVEERNLLRELLKNLFPFTKAIDRRIFFFEEAATVFPLVTNYDSIKHRLSYILKMTAGWKVSTNEYPWNIACIKLRPTYYLELPIQRAIQSEGHSTLMAEALYRIQSREFLLALLRHGVTPNAFYLWPVALLADLKLLLNSHTNSTTDILEPERNAIHYYCRARVGFRRLLVNPETENDMYQVDTYNGQIDSNLLLIPASTASLIPEDWSSNPCPLQHLSRLAIRSRILETDHLPVGIETLPLPKPLKEYIDLKN